MPYLPARPCRTPGCPALVTTKDGYCDQHRRATHREYKARRTDTDEQAFYNTPQWKRLRAQHLTLNPLCQPCKDAGRTTLATITHHKQPIKNGGHPTHPDNLESVCTPCHNRKHPPTPTPQPNT